LTLPTVFGANCGPAGQPSSSDEAVGTVVDDGLGASIATLPQQRFCRQPPPGYMACHAHYLANPDGSVKSFATPQGYGPTDLQSAYKIPAGGSGMTVAIVDAQDDPNAESDLATYRSTFGLPACTTANGCFKKVNQSGAASPLPSADSGWAGEIALDLDMVSSACPSCKIILVEASAATTADLGAAVNTAAALGAMAISNSYGGTEDGSEASYDSEYYYHPGIAITASSGDSGYGASYPATGAHVIAVGGTSLSTATGARGWTETAWNSGGSGCSSDVAKPTWQTDASCAKRMEVDIAAVADPNTGVAVYDTYGGSGWNVYGGTSAASPLVAGIIAATGLNGSKQMSDASWFYSHKGDLYDVTSGSNGTCSVAYECDAGVGYDGPTGWGTPNAALWSGTGTGTGSGSGSSASSASSTSSKSSSSSSASTASSSSSSSSSSTSSSSGGGSCAHSDCTAGTKLTSGCNSCVTSICASDSYCCSSQWDSVCVGEVASICGGSCGSGSGSGSASSSSASTKSSSSSSSSSSVGGGTCSHSDCTSGTKLVKGCNSCVTKICAADSYCCSTKWDNVCVSEVTKYCSGVCGQ
jgi:hypothetical protein